MPLTITFVAALCCNTAAQTRQEALALEEITVPAPGYSDSVQDFPLALTVTGADILRDNAIASQIEWSSPRRRVWMPHSGRLREPTQYQWAIISTTIDCNASPDDPQCFSRTQQDE